MARLLFWVLVFSLVYFLIRRWVSSSQDKVHIGGRRREDHLDVDPNNIQDAKFKEIKDKRK